MPSGGVYVKYKLGRRLVGDRTAKSSLTSIQITQLAVMQLRMLSPMKILK